AFQRWGRSTRSSRREPENTGYRGRLPPNGRSFLPRTPRGSRKRRTGQKLCAEALVPAVRDGELAAAGGGFGERPPGQHDDHDTGDEDGEPAELQDHRGILEDAKPDDAAENLRDARLRDPVVAGHGEPLPLGERGVGDLWV